MSLVVDKPLHDANIIYAAGACGFAYILLTKLAQMVIKPGPQKPGFVKKVIVPLHNFILIAWSLYMHLTIWSAMLSRPSFSSIACPTGTVRSAAEDAALQMLLASKFYEFFDTVVHVLLGHKISFLHIFHHSIVPATTASWYVADIGMVLPGACFNTGVHVFMYTYYLLSSFGYSPPWKAWVTTLQVLQFIVSMCAFIVVNVMVYNGHACQNMGLFYLASAFNGVLLVLFFQLLLSAKKKRSGAEKKLS